VPHRFIRRERQPSVEAPLGPGAVLHFPIARSGTALLHEREVLRVAHRVARDAESRKIDRMRPFLVVEHEAVRRRRTEHERSASQFDVAF